jgi:2-desacetyl-2-hydroxyethyl bacteriochlorophyllide A dehydrogenase
MKQTNMGVIFQSKKQVILQDKPLPQPQPGEVLIRTRVTMISTGTELTILEVREFDENSSWARYGRFPFAAGYNNIGVVEQAGSEADQAWVGRRVATYGLHSQFVIVKVADLRPVPDAISDEEAVFFTFAEITMQGTRRGQLAWGETAVVYGAGLIGQMVARFAHFAGARHVFSVDVSDFRLSLLPKTGRIIPVNPQRGDLIGLIQEKTDGRMADVVYETTGNSQVIPSEFEALRAEGRMVIVSSPGGKTIFSFQEHCSRNSYTIIGSHNRSHTPVQTLSNPWTQGYDCRVFFEWLQSGEISVKELITHQAPWRDAVQMYEMLMADRTRAMGVLLDWR